jgi:hypothetical protein
MELKTVNPTVKTPARNFMSHLAMLEAKPDGSDPTTWLEPFADDEYRKANQQ